MVLGTHHEEATYTQFLELLECGRGSTGARIQDLGHLMAELEGGRLKAQVASGADLQDEAKVDVYQVPLIGDHDVAVVPVLALQQITGHCIPVPPQQRCEQGWMGCHDG